uniref:Uncharacterized protein n=1 Tax=Caenorhabditis tropicalis TaxID=1561998 RepID=A0A1I7SXY5_9PELO
MFRWLFQGDHVAKSFDSPSETQSARDDRSAFSNCDNFLLFDLVVGEIETAVVKFELEKEQKEEEERKAERRPDYSWLISAGSRRLRKELSINEPTSREDIIEKFVIATHDTIQSRKHEPTLTEVIKSFASGKGSSLHSVRHGEMPRETHGSSRNIAELSFIELQEIV